MRTCRFDAQITPYLEGELSASARSELEGHLVSCATCRAAVSEERAVRDLVRARAAQARRAGAVPPWRPSDLGEQTAHRWGWRGALAFATGVCLVMAGVWVTGPVTVSATGRLIDSVCAEDPAPEMAGHTAACVRGCIRNGAEFVLVANGAVHRIRNQGFPGLHELAGLEVEVRGTMGPDGLVVSDAAPVNERAGHERLVDRHEKREAE